MPAGDRATARVREPAAAERSRRPRRATLLGAALGLIAGLVLAGARDAVDVRRPTARRTRRRRPGADPVGPPPAADREPALDPIVDLHCHILPGIDDGPRTLAESVELGRMLVDAGVRIVAATPHLRADYPRVVPGELAERCAELRDHLAGEGVTLDVVPAGELDLLWALGASAEDLRLVSYGQRGTDLLIETPYGPLPSSFEDHLFKLTMAGYRILLAHPERNRTFQQRPGRLAELVGRGTLVQVTTASLVPSSRRHRSARLGRALMKQGLVHVLASDAHGPGARMGVALRPAIEAAREAAGDRAGWMLSHAPAAVLTGETLPPPAPLPPRRHPLRAVPGR